jgi:UDP:flavonoid glycosyltransferase YjiC (YdhE family)
VEPLVALGAGLQVAGYQVRVATHPTFEGFVREAGLEFSLIDIDLEAHLNSDTFRETRESSRNPVRLFRNLARSVKPMLWQIATDSWRASQDADAILYTIGGFWFAPHIGEKLQIPAIGAYPYPIGQPTHSFPNILISPRRNLGGPLNRLTHSTFDFLLWVPLRAPINQWRSEGLGLPPCGLAYPQEVRQQGHPTLYGFSPAVIPKPPDWGEHIHITGYWFLDQKTGWEPPERLVEFLESGPPPLYVGFGSAGTQGPRETMALVLQALARTKQRGILLAQGGELDGADLPDTVLGIKSVPFDWLFPRVSAVIHHGGAGTTAAGLRAGVPTIIVPSFMDQPFWGQRVADMGLGPPPVPLKQLSASALEDSINTVLQDRGMRDRAAEIGAQVQREQGIASAIAVIDRHLHPRL